MRKFTFNKLVRNDILGSMLSEGAKPVYRVLSQAEYIAALKAKIFEEGAELDIDDPGELVKELADISEIIDCLVAAIGKAPADLKTAQAKKIARYGSFDKRIYIDTVEVNDPSTWIGHYLENPDRYPEIPYSGGV